MTDIFDQEGITFEHSDMASTAPQPAGANIKLPQISISELHQSIQSSGPVPTPPDPETINARLAATGAGAQAQPQDAGTPAVAPPLASNNSGRDIFEDQGIEAQKQTTQTTPGDRGEVPDAFYGLVDNPSAGNSFAKGVVIPNGQDSNNLDVQKAQVTQYVLAQQAQARAIAATRFTPDQIKSFANNPVSTTEAIQNRQDWSDIPTLLQKADAGEGLDESQHERLGAYIDHVTQINLRGQSWNGNTAAVGGQLPASAVRYASSGQSGNLSGIDAPTGQPSLNGNPIVPAPYTPKVGEKPLNEFMAVTDKGDKLINEGKDKPATNALKAMAYALPESANAPGHLNPNLISSVNDLPASLRSALYDVYKGQNPQARLADVMTPQGFSKAVDAIGEDKAAAIVHWYSAMTFEEHQRAQYAGGVLPFSVDEQGHERLDPRSGILGFFMAPGDVEQGRLQPGTPEFNEAASNVALGVIGGDIAGHPPIGPKKAAGGVVADQASKAAQDTVKPTTVQPEPTIEHYIDTMTPAKDQTMVDSGIVSIEGAKSAPTQTAEAILQKKGLDHPSAQEAVANMTANEKDQFINQNLKGPTGTIPTVDKIEPAGMPVEAARIQEALPAANDDVATAVGKSQAEAQTVKDPPPIDDNESGYNALTQRLSYLYRRMVNVLAPIENVEKIALQRGADIADGQSPKLLSNLYGNIGSLVNHYLSVENFSWLADGSTKVTGKSLKSIMDDFDSIAMKTEPNKAARFKDFNDYLLSHRYLELERAGEGKVKPDQAAWSKERLGQLSQKYGDNLHLVENLAQEIYGTQRRTLDMLVDTGVISPEMRDALNKKYQRYVPLDRVFGEDEKAASGQGKSTGKFSGAGPQGIIQRLKGSEREAREPLLNIYERTHKAVDRAYRNRVAQSVDNLKEILPEYIQKESPRIVNKGKAQVRITHDPVLDKKLDAAIEHFRHSFERKPALKVKGYRNVLGYYDPMEKLIRTKLGANEAVKTHEVGHLLDYELGLGDKMLGDPEIKAQLQKLAEERIGSDPKLVHGDEGVEFLTERRKAGAKYTAYLKNNREIIANMFDAYVNAPELLEKIAPKAKEAFEKILGENKELSFISDIKPSLVREERTIEKNVFGEASELPPNTIEVYNNGERNLLRVAKPLYEAMTQLGPARTGFLEKLLRGTFGLSARILRTGATSTVSFIERNVFRDQMDAMIQGGVGYNAPWDFSKGLFSAFGHDELYNSWVRGGGKMHFMAMGDEGMAKSFHEMLYGEGRLKQLWELAPRLSEKFEQATRIGLYNAAKRKGLSDIEAAHASLEGTLNFGRGGDVTKKLNQYIPFLNAGVQATDKLIRTAYKNPKLTLMWGIGSVTLPTVAITGYYLYGADEKTRQEYLEIPQWQKDMFWTVKIGDEWRSFPKPFSWGYMFGSIPERVMVAGYHGNKPETKDMWGSVIKGLFGTLSPVNDWSAAIPPLLKVVAEWQSNYNFFMGRNIYPTWMDDLPPEQRKNAYTSQTAQIIGEKLGQSPALIENSIRDLTGGVGGYGLKAGDAMLDQVKRWNGTPVSEKPPSDADNILLQGFTVRDPIGSNSNSVQNFYENYKEAKQAHLGQKQIPEDQKEAYIDNRQQQIESFGMMERAHKQISDLQKEVVTTYKDTNLSGGEKKKIIRELNSQITDVAREANMGYNAAANAGRK